ncbi:MAG TPA: hypothetical protein VE782_10940, partial [Myxococcaceae bacterium]|nr:hypothetical protein [Myxococcaceae bacterium]
MPAHSRRSTLVSLLIAALCTTSCRSNHATHSAPDAGIAATERGGVASDRDGVTADLLSPSIQPVGPEDAVPTSVVIDLGRAVVEQDALEKPLRDTRVRVEPETPGTVVFTSPSTLTFKPARPFAYGTRYAVTLEAVQARDAVLVKPQGANWSGAFETPQFQFARITAQQIDYARNQVTLRIAFTGPVAAAQIGKFLAFQIEGQNLEPSQLKQVAPNAVTANLSAARVRPSGRLVLDVRPGLPEAGGRAKA